MIIGIIGHGIVGSAIEHAFKGNVDFLIHDPPRHGDKSVSIEEIYNEADSIFIGVPTPMVSVNGGEIDSTILDEVMEELFHSSMRSGFNDGGGPVICIKSTIVPNKLKEYEEKYSRYLRLTMSPEYLTEANYLDDMIDMRALVVGGKPDDTQAIVDLFEEYSNCKKGYPVGQVDLVAAGVLKYMENCFLALKVTFMNQMYDVLQASGSNDSWENVAQTFQLDSERMGTSHWMVPGPDGDRGWGGKCFPKDINAMICYCKEIGVDFDLLEKAWEINMRIRTDIDWARIKGAVSAGLIDE